MLSSGVQGLGWLEDPVEGVMGHHLSGNVPDAGLKSGCHSQAASSDCLLGEF